MVLLQRSFSFESSGFDSQQRKIFSTKWWPKWDKTGHRYDWNSREERLRSCLNGPRPLVNKKRSLHLDLGRSVQVNRSKVMAKSSLMRQPEETKNRAYQFRHSLFWPVSQSINSFNSFGRWHICVTYGINAKNVLVNFDATIKVFLKILWWKSLYHLTF